MKSVSIFLLTLVFVSSLFPPSGGVTAAGACLSCSMMMQGPPCQEFWRADAVFVGTVTEVDAVDWSGTNFVPYSEYRKLTARISIEETFRGAESAEIKFVMNDCPYPFKQGERYIVYAHKDREGKLYQRIGGSRTRPLAEAEEDLDYLRGPTSAEPGSSIIGKVTRRTHNIKEVKTDLEPLKSLKVILSGGEHHQVTVTDSEGKYEFTGLPAGAYSVRAELPANLSFDEQTVKVTGRGCVPLDISAARDGQIDGRVLDASGQAVASVPISLVSADAGPEEILSEGRDRGLWSFTSSNEQGRFTFSQLAPGRYMLIINRAEFERSRGNERAKSLPRLFYPGVPVMQGATVITVREGQKGKEYRFRLPPE